MKNGFSIATLAVFLLSGCVSDRPQAAKNAYESDYERFFQNVIVKEKTPHYVTYEYKDVRIDEIGRKDRLSPRYGALPQFYAAGNF